MPSMRAILAMVLLAVLATHMTGCLAWEVRDELRLVNASMDDIKVQLGSVNDGLRKLERTNTVLADLDMKLTSLETTNASLASIDQHLASLRRTLNNISSTMPFLKVSGDDEDELVETAEERADRELQERGAAAGQDSPRRQPSEPASEPQGEPAPAAEPAPTDPKPADPG